MDSNAKDVHFLKAKGRHFRSCRGLGFVLKYQGAKGNSLPSAFRGQMSQDDLVHRRQDT